MLITTEKLGALDTKTLWWPTDVKDVIAQLENASITTVMQCDDAFREELSRYVFRSKPYTTLLIDLTQDEDDIFAQFSSSCRRDVRKAERTGYEIQVNERLDEAFDLLNASIEMYGYRSPIGDDEWMMLTNSADVFTVTYEDQVVATDVIYTDGEQRAFRHYAATIDRSDAPELKRILGQLNRALLWETLRYYKERGVKYYDVGGIVTDPESPLYSIAEWKMSFGGERVTENIVRLAGSGIARNVLSTLFSARLKVKALVQKRAA